VPAAPNAEPTGWEPVAGLAQVVSEHRIAILDPSRPAHPPVILEDAAAAIWSALIEHPLHSDLIAALADIGIPQEQTEAFLVALEDAGLARRTGSD
jgi:hypothetical protein